MIEKFGEQQYVAGFDIIKNNMNLIQEQDDQDVLSEMLGELDFYDEK